MTNGIAFLDILLSLFYIFVILFLARLFKPKGEEAYNTFYFKYIYSKIVFAILFSIIYIFYFGGGDTFLYFEGSIFFIEQITHNPNNIFNLLFTEFGNLRNFAYTENRYLYVYLNANDILLTSRILILFTALCAKQYLATTILFTAFTSIGLWKLYVTLCKLYPNLYKFFAVGILFYPTIGIWGSGILKDPITLMCVGLIFSSFYNFSIGSKILPSLIISLISFYVCLILKPYILYIFLPCMLFWLQSRISSNFKSSISKLVMRLVLSGIFIFSGFFLIQGISDGAGKYSLENVQEVAEGFQGWHSYLAKTRNQSGYSLGDFEFNAQGILQKSPAAFFVTFFRPFIFTDVNNFSLAFEGIQTFILLILSIIVFIRVGIFKFFRFALFNKDVSAFFLFALIFGITIGLTSYNFGALSRYKLPCLPFYVASITIIYYLGYLKPKKGYQ